MSIRTRLAVAVALVLTATLVALGVVIVRSTRATLVAQVDDQVRTNAAHARDQVPLAGVGPPPGSAGAAHPSSSAGGPSPASASASTGPYERAVALFVYSAQGKLLVNEPCGFADAPNPPPRLPPIPSPRIDALVNHVVTTPAVTGTLSYRVLVQRDPGPSQQIYVTAASLASVYAAVSRLIRILVIVGAVALAAATLASWWLIRRGLRPVDRMVDTAAAIAAGDLSRRVPDAGSRTELERLGGALNEMLTQIEHAVQARARSEERLRRFIADAAHELRTPLTSLRGYAELYRQGALRDPASLDNAMRRIEGEGARMARLVEDMLLLARLDQQRGLERKDVDLVGIVREAVSDFRVVAPDHPLTDELVETATVNGDRIRLRQIVDNLLTNARTHTPPSTPVLIAVARRGEWAELSVRDEGPGITEEDQARVFERFWRADPARVRRTGGSGLGLAIVASLVQAHGGTVDLQSEPGHGATFMVRLPLAAPANAGR